MVLVRSHMWVSLVRVAVVVTSALWGASCTTLPDTKPFGDATAAMKPAISSSFNAAIASEGQIASYLPDEQRAKFRNAANALRDTMPVRLEVLSRLVDYADTLDGMVKQAKDEREAIDDYAAAATKLAEQIPAELGGSAVPSLVIKGVQDLAKEIQNIRTAKHLAEATALAKLPVNEIADGLVADMTDLETILRVNRAAVIAAIDTQAEDFIKFRDGLLADRAALVNALPERSQNLNGRITAIGDITKVEQLLVLAAPEQAALESRRVAALADLDQKIAIVRSTKGVISEWKKAHGDLIEAIKTGREVNARNLKLAVEELTGLIDQAKKAFK